MLATVIKNFSFLGISVLFTKFLSFIVETVLARELGPELFGILGFSLTVIIYFSLILNKGLEFFGTREVSRNLKTANLYLNNILSLRILFSIGAISLLIFSIWFLPFNLTKTTKIVITLYGFQLIPLAFSGEWFLQGIQRMDLQAYSQIIGQAFYFLAIIIFFKNKNILFLVPIFFSLGLLLSTSSMWYFINRHFGLPKLTFNKSLWKKILLVSSPMGLSALMATMYNSLDLLFLGIIKGAKSVGFYRADYRLLALVFLVPTIISQVIFPGFSKLKKDKIKESKLADVYLRVMIFLAIGSGFGITAFSEKLVLFLYGPTFSPAIPVLKILGITFTFNLLSYTFGHPLLAWDKQKIHLIIVSTGALVNLILNLILIPPLGMIGAAIATITAEGLVFIGFLRVFKGHFPVPFLKYLLRPLLAGLGLILLAIIFKGTSLNFLLIILITGVLYFLFLLFTKYFSPIFNL